ncbi:MAG: hypothetical protein FJ125_07430 [Deltaproteobacteria bacterium]|nr:hypothetical protein [Deltaproteobacteria bacterium]
MIPEIMLSAILALAVVALVVQREGLLRQRAAARRAYDRYVVEMAEAARERRAALDAGEEAGKRAEKAEACAAALAQELDRLRRDLARSRGLD